VDPNVSKSVSPTQSFIGGTVTFTLTVTNGGTGVANNVTVSDTLSSFFDVVSTSATRGTASVDGRTITFSVGTVNPGETVSLTIVARVNYTATTGDIPNVASLSHVVNGTTFTESSNTVTVRISGTSPLLPVTGEPPEPNVWMWFVSWLLGLIGGLLLVFGLYRLWRANQDQSNDQRRNWAAIVGGGMFVLLSLACSLPSGVSLLPVNRGEQATVVIQIPASQATQVVDISEGIVVGDTIVIVPTSAPEVIETMPAYATPTPPAVSTPQVVSDTIALGADTTSVTRIAIPSQDVDAEVRFVPFDGLTWSMQGLRKEVAWLGDTSWPGLGGNTAFAGHVLLKGGILGPFYETNKLKPGDEIVVYTERNVYTYAMTSRQSVEPSDVSVTEPNPDGKATITLITCTDWDTVTFTYLKRLIVTAELVSVAPLP
jgi:LPXTG-site transpeptidase (sortase) family protein